MTFSEIVLNRSRLMSKSFRDASPSYAYKIRISDSIGASTYDSKYFSNFLSEPFSLIQKWRRYFMIRGD